MTLILNVPENREATLKAKAQVQGVPVEQYVERVLDQDLDEPATTSATASPRHISEVIREIWSDVPAEAWEKMPTDGASEHDHYIYGLPKRNT
jgi:hypothetical protein